MRRRRRLVVDGSDCLNDIGEADHMGNGFIQSGAGKVGQIFDIGIAANEDSVLAVRPEALLQSGA